MDMGGGRLSNRGQEGGVNGKVGGGVRRGDERKTG